MVASSLASAQFTQFILHYPLAFTRLTLAAFAFARYERCGKALIAAEARGGQFIYYVCTSLIRQGSGACHLPYLNAHRFKTCPQHPGPQVA